MKKIFTVKGIVPFDLFRWGKDGFYNFLDTEYSKQFGADIEILEAKLEFIKGGIKAHIITFKEG